MNTDTQSEKPECRRSRERYVGEALNAVQKWRDLFENGYYNEVGNLTKPSLKEAADIVGLPKRTLENYYAIFKKIPESTDVMRLLDKKMGHLNQLLKELKNESAVTFEQQDEILPEQGSWDNMIIEADDQLAVQREDDDINNDRMVLEQQLFENEEDYIKYLQFEEDHQYFQEYQEEYFFNTDDNYFDDEFNNPALPES